VGPLRRSLAWLSAVALAPLLFAVWLARPRLREGLGERLGRVPEAGAPGAVWVHAASVGEAAAALGLIDSLRARGHAVRATTTTTTGRALLARARPGLAVSLAPLDHPLAVEAALARTRPSALVLVETELWPCLIAGAFRRGIPVLVVSGRLSDASFPRYRRLRRLLAPTLARLAAVAARSEEDARRFAELGVPAERLCATGDLKLEPAAPPALPAGLAEALAGAPCLVAGSTHPGEEEAALDAFAAVRAEGLAAALVLAPRRPERFAAVAELLAARGLAFLRRSALAGARAAPGAGRLAPGGILLLDSLGELGAVYGRARAAFVGGSLVPGVGGHNVLEPLLAGCPVSFGPHTESAREAACLALASGAGERVDGAAALARAWVRDLRAPEAAAARGAAGRAALLSHQGAARRAVERIEAALAAVGTAAAPDRSAGVRPGLAP
jgi:3-deoxy-D-manno-octulosonic-acid transferase